MPPAFRRFTDVSSIAYFGQGLLPALSLYALDVLGMSAGFAVRPIRRRGGRPRWLARWRPARSSTAARRAVCCEPASWLGQPQRCAAFGAIPANPLAPAFLFIGSALSVAGNAGPGDQRAAVPSRSCGARVHCPEPVRRRDGAAAGARVLVCATALALAPPAAWGIVRGPVCRVGDQSNDRDVSNRGLRFVDQPVSASPRDLDSGPRHRLAKPASALLFVAVARAGDRARLPATADGCWLAWDCRPA